MRERLTLRERVLFGIIATGLVLSIAAPSCDPVRSSPVTVQEDDPRWDCTRDGNRVCGHGRL